MDQPGEKISVEEFDAMRARYEQSAPAEETRSVLFGAEKVKQILKSGVDAVRIYLGRTSDDKLTLMLKPEGSEALLSEEDILDRGQLCPPYCADK